jgi:LPS-assembly lipoprotein
MSWSRLGLVLAVLALAGCGFQLRGDERIGISRLHLSSEGGSQVAVEIRRSLATGSTQIVTDPAKAEASLRIMKETRDKTIFTLTGAGRVYEYELRLTTSYQLTEPGKEEPLIAPSEIVVRRLITYSETAPLAKEAEEQLLFKDMYVESAGLILRRIAVVKRGL